MKLKFIKPMEVRSDWRQRVVVIVFALMVSFGLIPAAAQQSAKRITSVWTTTTAEGSRVTVDSDSSLNDYEAYKRGDRFYVKIPLADLPSARGSLLGRGFDDVQIQRYGDGIILSFRLLPGTTAHVDQKLNRLDVIFATPGRFQNVGATSVGRDDIGSRTRVRRIEDSAGPMPPSSTKTQTPKSRSTVRHPARENGSGYVASSRTGSRSSHKARPKSLPSIDRTLTPSRNGVAAKGSSPQTGTSAAASSSASPVPSPSPHAESAAAASSATPYSAPASSSTPVALSASSAASQSPVNVSSRRVEANSWSSRMNYLKWWVKLNWLPLLIGGLVFVSLLALLLFRRRAKRGRVIESQPSKQPVAAADAATTGTSVQTMPKAESRAASAGLASAAAVSAVRTKSAVGSTPARKDEPVDEFEEREVFEI